MSFYVYETQHKPKCQRCGGEERLPDHEFCEPCIFEMIMPGYSASFQSEEIEKEARRANGC